MCILATSSWYLLLLLGPYRFCALLCPSLHEMFPWYLIFLKRSVVFPILLFSSIPLQCSSKMAYLSFLFSGTLHSGGYVFPFLPCLLFLFFSQLFVSPPQTTNLPFCIYFSWGWFWSPLPIQCYEFLSIVLQALCLSDLIPWISICHFHCIIIRDLI